MCTDLNPGDLINAEWTEGTIMISDADAESILNCLVSDGDVECLSPRVYISLFAQVVGRTESWREALN